MSWDTGKQLLAPFFAEPKLTPEKIAIDAEVSSRNAIPISDLEKCEQYWAIPDPTTLNGRSYDVHRSFEWRRNKTARGNGYVHFPIKNKFGQRVSGSLTFESSTSREFDWSNLFETWCRLAEPSSGVLHIDRLGRASLRDYSIDRDARFQDEVQQRAWGRFLSGTLETDFSVGTRNSTVSGLTNLGFANYFGGALADEVDAERISSEGFYVKRISEGFLIKVSEDLFDVIDDYPYFSRRRALLKSLFRPGLFLIEHEPRLVDAGI